MSRSPISEYLPPWRTFAAYSAISMAIGILIILLLGVGRTELYSLPAFAIGALLGFFINLGAFTAEVILFAALGIDESWKRGVRRSLGLLSYFVGGAAGYVLGGWMASLLAHLFLDARPSWAYPFGEGYDLSSSVLVFGLLALVIGLVFNIVSYLREQLENSVARIKEQEYAEKELETARALQQRLLPPPSVAGPGFRIEARNLPAARVAGDFYDVFRLPDGALGLVVGDVAGKGMGASLLVASVKAMLPLLAAERTVADTLRELNRRLSRDLGPREFVALAFARFDPTNGRLELGNAGLPDPYRQGSELEPIEVPGPRLPLGVRSEVEYRSREIVLAEGERLLLLSDGLPEAPRSDGSPLGYGDLVRILEHLDGDAGEWLDRVIADVRSRTREPQDDDWTALLVERVAAGSALMASNAESPADGSG